MSAPLRLPLVTLLVLAAAVAVALSPTASAAPTPSALPGLGATLRPLGLAPLHPSLPTDPPIHGVAPGGAPWVLESGGVAVRPNGFFGGFLVLFVRGLVIPSLGTPGAVTSITASVFCDSDTTPDAVAGPVPLSRAGDAFMFARVSLPSTCTAPDVLVNPNGNLTRYIASAQL